MTLTARTLYQAVGHISDALACVPRVSLLAGERMTMAGHIFNEADPFVRAVAKALDDDPALFSDVPIDPKHLALRQDRVMAYHALHYALSSLTRRPNGLKLSAHLGRPS